MWRARLRSTDTSERIPALNLLAKLVDTPIPLSVTCNISYLRDTKFWSPKMLSNQRHSPEVGPVSPSTIATTPEQDLEDDNIWDSDGHGDNASPTGPTRGELLSDLPTVKRQHMTDGYREGLAIGKAKVMQEGFDHGYPIGIQIALRVGKVIGVIEGYLATKSISQDCEQSRSLKKLYERAREELSCPALLKDISDEQIADSTTIPPSIDAVISEWENHVLGLTRNTKN